MSEPGFWHRPTGKLAVTAALTVCIAGTGVVVALSPGGSSDDAAQPDGAPAATETAPRPGSDATPPPEDPPDALPPAPTEEDPIDYALQKLDRANAAFNAPATLQVDETKEIELRVSDAVGVGELRSQLSQPGERETARIRASDVMEANLTGLGFKIQAVSPRRQAVGGGVTTWRWQIEPTKTGRLRLHLTLTALIAVNEVATRIPGDTKYAVRTFDRTLDVQGVPVAWHERLTDFVSANWQWLITTLLIPLGAWGISRWRNGRQGTGVAGAAADQPKSPRPRANRPRRARRGSNRRRKVRRP